jgi:hypothetical protein
MNPLFVMRYGAKIPRFELPRHYSKRTFRTLAALRAVFKLMGNLYPSRILKWRLCEFYAGVRACPDLQGELVAIRLRTRMIESELRGFGVRLPCLN